MMRQLSVLFLLALLGALTSACSGRLSPPVVPETGLDVTGECAKQASTGATHLWGLYEVQIDRGSWSVEVVPLREADFTCNVTMFLQPPAGKLSNLGIKITDLSGFYDQGKLDVEVTLTHPFPGLDTYTGFDVLGVFIHHGDTLSIYDSSVNYARGADTARLLNADGWTRWYNPSEFTASNLFGFKEGALGNKNMGFTATINPYKYFCDGLGPADDLTEFLHGQNVPQNRNMFRSTSSNKRLYKLQFPMVSGAPYLTFQYAVVASWEPPQPDPPHQIPGDFPQSANIREPFMLSIADNGSTLYYSGGVGGGTLRIRAELFDWGAASNPSGILGEFSKVVIESPNADIPGGYAEFFPEDFAAFVQPSTLISSVAELEFDGVAPKGPEDVDFLVTVVAKDGETYDQGFGVPVPSAPLASYFRFVVPIGENPCANFSVTGADPASAKSGEKYTGFAVYGANFQNGTNLAVDIVDGASVLASGTAVTFVSTSEITCNIDFCGVKPGNWQLRVTNGCDPVSYAYLPYVVGADPLKNMNIRPGFAVRDLGIRETTGEPYVLFNDGQLWIYSPDYSSGVFKTSNANLDFVDVLDNGDAAMGDATGSGEFIYHLDTNWIELRGAYGNTSMDCTETDPPGLGDRAYWWKDGGGFIYSVRRTPTTYGGNIAPFFFIGSGPGLINLSAFKALHTSRQNSDSTYAMWVYALEGSPEFAIERYDYYAAGGDHNMISDLTICGSQGDGNYQLNDPKDISGDAKDNIYILDLTSSSQPTVRIYTKDGVYLGQFGDSTTISGTPLRLDVDEGDGEVHVAHTNGISVFRPCEIPI